MCETRIHGRQILVTVFESVNATDYSGWAILEKNARAHMCFKFTKFEASRSTTREGYIEGFFHARNTVPILFFSVSSCKGRKLIKIVNYPFLIPCWQKGLEGPYGVENQTFITYAKNDQKVFF